MSHEAEYFKTGSPGYQLSRGFHVYVAACLLRSEWSSEGPEHSRLDYPHRDTFDFLRDRLIWSALYTSDINFDDSLTRRIHAYAGPNHAIDVEEVFRITCSDLSSKLKAKRLITIGERAPPATAATVNVFPLRLRRRRLECRRNNMRNR